ncbi:MAG: hypothetical protein IJO32_06625 [Bacilli bacterium]|nr:hypothetical protein [Bacilli bacterium]
MKFSEIHEQNVERDNKTLEDTARKVEGERIRKQFLDDMEDELMPAISNEEKIRELKNMKDELLQQNDKEKTTNRHI